MLVLTRKTGETIELTGGIVITFREISRSIAKVTIAAPPDVKIVRGELAKKVLDERAASDVVSE